MELITGKTGVPHVYAADDAELYRLFLGDGAYVLPTGNKLNATMNGASSVRVFDGSIIMQGRLAKIRPTTGFDELSLAAGVVGQKRVDLVVAEYHKEQEEVIDAWIVGDEPLAIDWLSLTDGGTAFVPEKGQLYKLKNTVGEYEADTLWRWVGNVYVRSLVQELEHCDTKIVQGGYNSAAYIEPEITTGDIDKGQTHQVKLWAIRFDGINVDGAPIDYRTFLTDTPYNTLIATALQTKAQVDSMMADLLLQTDGAVDNIAQQIEDFSESISSQILTGEALYVKTEQLSTIQSGNTIAFNITGISYSPQAGDTIELYINGLKTNSVVDDYTVSVANNVVTFTFETARDYSAKDYGEIVIRR